MNFFEKSFGLFAVNSIVPICCENKDNVNENSFCIEKTKTQFGKTIF